MDAIQQLELLAEKLGELRDAVVVVGGCAPALILDIGTAPDLRITDDVDILIHTPSYRGYIDFIDKLKAQGFVEREGDPIGRCASGELVVDVVPTEADVLGFTNRWYTQAFGKAVRKKLPSGKSIKTVTSVYFVATNLEAFKQRGRNDFMTSVDFEDIITVLMEHRTFEQELKEADLEVQKYISAQFKEIVSNQDYPHVLSAHVRGDEASQAFVPMLRELIERIASREFYVDRL